jgi:hypothetical protein
MPIMLIVYIISLITAREMLIRTKAYNQTDAPGVLVLVCFLPFANTILALVFLLEFSQISTTIINKFYRIKEEE